MNKFQRNLWLVATVVFATVVTIVALSYIVTEPWRILPDIGGDGAKNNFTYLYHCLYGKGYWFEGMNYPYGEHIVFTDGQPLLSVLIAVLGNSSVGTALTVCWWLLGISYVLSIVYVYKTLIYFKVGPLPALIFAGLIGILTPQILCLRGHYALAYPCVIPMMFYWNILYHATGKYKYCVWVFITGCIAAFLHPYYAAMLLVCAGAYSVGYFIFTKAKFASKIKHTLPLLSSVIGILLVVAVVMKLTDPVKDRPVTPFNPMEANTHIKQILTSAYSPFWEMAQKMGFMWEPSSGGEGYTYLGLVTIASVLLFFGLVLLKRFFKKDHGIDIAATGFSPIWLFVAFGVLALSMGIPFIWNMKWLMDYISFFKQFRALGRFSWIFYYLMSIYGVVVLYAFYNRLAAMGKKVIGYTLLILAIGVWTVEASGYVRFSRDLSKIAAYNYDVIFSTNEQGWKSYLGEQHLAGNDFQAILVLGFYHIGSEKIWVGDGSWSNTLATRAGLQLHLPIVDVMMSRSSWSLAKKQVKIVGGPYTDKSMLRDIKSKKPFLLLRFDEDSINVDQLYLLSASDYIGHFSQCSVYKCYPDRIIANDRKKADEVNAVLPYIAQGDTCISGEGSWIVHHFDMKNPKGYIFGGGSVPDIKADDSVMAMLPVKPVGDSQLYEISSWFLLGDKDPRAPYVNVELLDNAGKVLSVKMMNTKESVDNEGMWFRAAQFFYVPSKCSTLKCTIVNTPHPLYLAMDELMLRPATSAIVSKGRDGSVMVNNHIFKKAK